MVGWWLGAEVGHGLGEWAGRKGDAGGIHFQVSGCSGMCVEQFVVSPDSWREKAVDAGVADHCPLGGLFAPHSDIYPCVAL